MGPSFNPRPAIAHGATWPGRRRPYSPEVSIRAPQLLTGRLECPCCFVHYCDVSIRAPQLLTGRRVSMWIHGLRCLVSIRAPQLLTGRPTTATAMIKVVTFQSAPRNCSRGDHRRPPRWSPAWCFNPRPAIAHGATRSLRQ